MVTVRKVVHSLELLVDDANARLVSAVGDLLDILCALAQGLELLVDDLGSFNGGLRVKFGCSTISIHKAKLIRKYAILTRVRNLEENALHDVAAIGTLELELVALEQDVIETPNGSGEDGVQATLTLLNFENQVDSALAGVTSSP